MENAVFPCWLLFLLLSPAAPSCSPVDYTMSVEKPECDFCVEINTSICMGCCPSKERNLMDFYSSERQTVCLYDKVEYRTVHLPGCRNDSVSAFTYPVALSCQCDFCNTHATECTHRSNPARCSKPAPPLYPFLGQSGFMTPF